MRWRWSAAYCSSGESMIGLTLLEVFVFIRIIVHDSRIPKRHWPARPAQPVRRYPMSTDSPVVNYRPTCYAESSAVFTRLPTPDVLPEDGMQLLKSLVRNGLLKPNDVEPICLAHAAAPGKALHEILIEKGYV